MNSLPMPQLISSKTGTFRLFKDSVVATDLLELGEFLKHYCLDNHLTQARICFHENNDSDQHVMLVFHSIAHVVRRHMHTNKSEYLIAIQGQAKIRLYQEHEVDEICFGERRDNASSRQMCLIPKEQVHDLVVINDLLFLEVTTGPFNDNETVRFS